MEILSRTILKAAELIAARAKALSPADTKTEPPKKTKRKTKWNKDSLGCLERYKEALQLDPTLERKQFIKDYAEDHGLSFSTLYKRFTDNPDMCT